MRAVILGATRGMGRALARLMAARGDQLFLLGRDEAQLSRSARDLEVRGAGSVGSARCDLAEPEGFEAALEAAQAALGGLDAVIVTAALFGTQEELEADPALATRLLTVNLSNTVAFCEVARKRLLAQGGGKLCVFSSVAGDRSRKPVGIYGASKAGLSHYLESLDLRYRASGLEVVCVKPGFVKTGMTAGLPSPPFAGEPEAVARVVLAALDRGQPLVYAPGVWRLIMGALRHTPQAVMRRVNF